MPRAASYCWYTTTASSTNIVQTWVCNHNHQSNVTTTGSWIYNPLQEYKTWLYCSQTDSYSQTDSADSMQEPAVQQPETRTVEAPAVIIPDRAARQMERLEEGLLFQEQSRLAAQSIAANDKAEAMLMAFLSPEQRKQYRAHRNFVVEVNTSVHRGRYLITHGIAGNVFLLNEASNVVMKFCAHIDQRLPVGDNLLAQKLLLENDPDLFIRTANATPVLQQRN